MDTNLLKYKSSGIKSTTDVAETTNVEALPSSARILVINSKKGDVNKLVSISDYENQYVKQFDAISEADERKGNFSARSAKYMLNVAPIYVLNLRKFDDEKDVAGIVEISAKADVKNGVATTMPYKQLHNTNQFWKKEPKKLINSSNIDKLLVLSNLGVSDVTVIVTKSNTQNYGQTISTWYSHLGLSMPPYLNPNDLVKDYMIDVHVFKTTFKENQNTHPTMGYCFDEFGNVKKEVVNSSNEKISGLEQLTRIADSGYLATYTGSLIKGFKNEIGTSIDIIEILNSYSNVTGILASRNDGAFDEAITWESDEDAVNGLKKPYTIDLKGHSIVEIGESNDVKLKTTEINVLSYNQKVTESTVNISSSSAIEKVNSSDSIVTHFGAVLNGVVGSDNKVTHSGDLNKLLFFGSESKPKIGDSFVAYDGNLAKVNYVRMLTSKKLVKNINTEKLPIQPFGNLDSFTDSHDWGAFDGVGETYSYPNEGEIFPKDVTNTYFVYPTTHKLSGLPLCFEKTVNGLASGVIHNPSTWTEFVLAKNVPYTVAEVQQLISNIADYTPSSILSVVKYSDISDEKINAEIGLDLFLSTYGVSDYVYEVTFDKALYFHANGLTTKIDDKLEFDKSKSVFVDDYGVGRLVYENKLYVTKVADFETISKTYKPIKLVSYKPRKEQFLNGTAKRRNEVLEVLKERSIQNGLQNKDTYTWSYIVDSFKAYIEPNVGWQFRDVAKDRVTARGIYNLPSPTQLGESTNPYFSDEVRGDFNAYYVPQGGNLELPYSNTFSLPSEDGFYAYGFGSHFVTTDGAHLPPAPIISNAFARKHKIGKPYMILAGDNGLISESDIIGVDYEFVERTDNTGDRDYLEPFGYNVVVKKSKGLQIYSNRTSFNTVDSPVSSIHTSEVIMYVQQEIALMLESFVFKYNTPQNRLIIQEKADEICKRAYQAGAISGYINKCDDKNNTGQVIANRLGILDTRIFNNNGMEIMLHRTTIDSVTNMASFEVTKG